MFPRIAGSAWLAILLLAAAPAGASSAILGEADREHYRSAFYHAGKGNWRDATIHASRAGDTVLAGVVEWLRLKGDPRSGFEEIRDFLAAHPDWPAQDALRRNAENAMPADLDAAGVIAFFETWPPMTDAGVARHVRALLEAGREHDADAAIEGAWRDHSFERAGEVSFLQAHGDRLDGRQHWERVDRLIWRGATAAAERLLSRLESDDLRALANARIRLRSHQPGVDNAIGRVPAHLQDDEGLLFERIDWRLDKDRPDSARELLPRAPRALLQPDRWAVLRLRIAAHLLRSGDHAGAYEVAAGHRAVHGAFHHRTEWLAGWIALARLGDPRTALNHFSHLYDAVSRPISLARGAYWSARAAEAIGSGALSMDWYAQAAGHGQTFYGQLAALRAGLDAALPEPPAAPQGAITDQDLGAAVHRLAEINERTMAQDFLIHMAAGTTSAPQLALIAGAALELRLHHAAVRTARRASDLGVVMLEARHPVLDLPDGLGVDDDLVLAVVNRESEFNARAQSGKNALGLMQVRPATARDVARRLGIETSRQRLLADKRHNILIGATYLRYLIRELEGSLVPALAAYNGGPGNVRKWLGFMDHPDRPDVDAVDWIESIPFRETRNYVQRVIETMQNYRVLRGEGLLDLFPAPGST